MTTPSRDCEALTFWKLSRAHTAACIATGVDSPMADQVREDIAAIALHSEWPLLQQRAGEIIDRAEAKVVFG